MIRLAAAPGAREAWDRSRFTVYLWAICELLFVTNPWQISSGLRVRVLRAFGAEIGTGVIMRPRVRVRFPWKLHIGDDCWVGEGVWFHNQDHIYLSHDCVVSQETLLTTGSHAHRRDMALITRPIVLEPGVWITSRCIVLGGAHLGRSALARPMTLVSGTVPANAVVAGPDGAVVGTRFPADAPRGAAGQADAGQTGPVPAAATRTDAAQPDAEQPDAGQPGIPRTDAAPADAGQAAPR
ncbi:MAG TPA: acetyltransferase [Gryllotalpicola sp.]